MTHDTGLIRMLPELEIPGRRAHRQPSRIDGMSIQHDGAGIGLAEYLRQSHARHGLGAYDILQYCTRTDRWQLVGITDEYQMAAIRYGRQQAVHEHDIHHRHLIDDDDIGIERLIRIAPENQRATGITGALRLKQAMHGDGLTTRRLREAFGRPARRRREQYLESALLQYIEHAPHDGRLACAWSARQHEYAMSQRSHEGGPLAVC